MATAANVIDNVEINMRDTNNLIYTAAEYLVFLNRAVEQLFYVLGGYDSDHVKEDTNLTLLISTYETALPTDCNHIMEDGVWIGTKQLHKWDWDYMNYKRQSGGTVTGSPDFWCHDKGNILFDKTSDQEYTVNVKYKQKATALESGTTMPFQNTFNEPLTQATTLIAKTIQEYDVIADAAIKDFLDGIVRKNVIGRNYKRRARKLDF